MPLTEEEWRKLAEAYRDYVPPPEPVDTDAEVAKRRAAMRSAIHGAYLAGGEVHPVTLEIMTRFVAGEITADQMITEIKKLWGNPE